MGVLKTPLISKCNFLTDFNLFCCFCNNPLDLCCLNCTKFGQLILRKIIEIVATRCQILSLKCTKFNFGWGSDRPRWGSLQRSPDPLAGFKGPTSKGREGREGKGGKGVGERRGRGAYVDTPVSARVGEGKHLPARSLLF